MNNIQSVGVVLKVFSDPSVLYLKAIGFVLLIVSQYGCNPFVKAAGEVTDGKLGQIILPEGFKIDVYAENIDGARSLALGSKGTLFVGSRKEGNVYALADTNNDYKADRKCVIASGLDQPNGVAFRQGALYVAEVSKIWKYENIEDDLSSPPNPILINDQYPDDQHHGWKYIAFGPDDKLYVPVGAPCNNCLSDEKIFATITRMDPDGTNKEIFASGIRNTVGFDWNPADSVMWFTDNGRDWMGDNEPPDELNRAYIKDLHFGYPFCHGNQIEDPVYGEPGVCDDYEKPVQNLGPHVAALGMIFYTGRMFPEKYRNQIFIAEHGSWNRSIPIGYRVTLVTLDGNEATSYIPFAYGWLQEGRAWGRPVDILELPDGSLLLSDDTADVIYRIYYESEDE
jgi:glucose/arabinose dehydrogenase